MKSCIVYGPQGCGKSLNAEAMRKFLGMKLVIDDVDDLANVYDLAGDRNPHFGHLILTCEVPDEATREGFKCFEFKDVIRLMEAKGIQDERSKLKGKTNGQAN